MFQSRLMNSIFTLCCPPLFSDCFLLCLFVEREGQGVIAASPKPKEGGEREDWRRGVRTRERERGKRGREGSGEKQRVHSRPPFFCLVRTIMGEELLG